MICNIARSSSLSTSFNSNSINDQPSSAGHIINSLHKSNNNINNEWCTKIVSSLNVTAWPSILYHKDYPNQTSDINYFDSTKFTSVEEDDEHARTTVNEFIKLRNQVLTPKLLNGGFVHGGLRPAKSFAKHVLQSYTSLENDATSKQQPIHIAVFGNSFTIGSNCGESSSQDGKECAWPDRLVRRWDEIFPTTQHRPIEWRMFQESSQSSGNIAQKLPSIIDEYYKTKRMGFDVIILDNTITDVPTGRKRPWFEAVVRLLTKVSPDTVIISVVDAVPQLVNTQSDTHSQQYLNWMHDVHHHYGLTVIDIARMAGILQNESSSEEDLLWPQTPHHMISSNGTLLDDLQPDREGTTPIYWMNFLPKVRKTKYANIPANHPPWPTHQYVADSVMYALLRVIERGLGCGTVESEMDDSSRVDIYEATTTVAPKEYVNGCFICMNPLTRIYAKSPEYTNIASTASIGSANNITPSFVSSGDWQWVTDEKGKSGWQSELYGSIIQFRLKISDRPTISITYMRSHATFGSLRVTFRTAHSPPLREADIYSLENGTIPSLLLTGKIPQFSLWETAVFPYKKDYFDHLAAAPWNLLNATVLSQMGSSSVEYVDMYVVNPNKSHRTRIKVQTVTSC